MSRKILHDLSDIFFVPLFAFHLCAIFNVRDFFQNIFSAFSSLKHLNYRKLTDTSFQLSLHKKQSFPLRISSVKETADSVTFTEEILNGKLHSLYNVLYILSYVALLHYYHKELQLITMQKPPFRKVQVFSVKDT